MRVGPVQRRLQTLYTKVDESFRVFAYDQLGMETLAVVTYNVMLMVDKPWRFQGASERSARLAHSLYQGLPVCPDVVCLQELATNYWDVVCSFYDHRHSAGPVESSWCSSKIKFWPSGLCTLSKYPITHEHHYIFTGETYHVELFVSKAALHTRVLHPVLGGVNVVNVHLNAWSTPRAQKARSDQIAQLARWLKTLQLCPDEPLVVTGDFNVDFYENFEQVAALAEQLGCRYLLPDTTQFSFDAAANELVGMDDPSEYKTVQGGQSTTPPRQLVDGFFIRQNLATAGTVDVVCLRSTDVFPLHFNVTTRRLARDLSDHFPVLLRLQLPVRGTTAEPFRRIVVKDGEFSGRIFAYQLAAVGALFGLVLYAHSKWSKKR